jgi:hypothetical protein
LFLVGVGVCENNGERLLDGKSKILFVWESFKGKKAPASETGTGLLWGTVKHSAT